MKTGLLLLLLTLTPLLHGQTSKDLLRDGLFAEESEGDLKTATEKYEALLKAFEAERKVAAVALFRLAAVKRKQGEDKAALALYEEFGKKFSNIEPQATLVRENYLAISGEEFPSPASRTDPQDQAIAMLQKQAGTNPDDFPSHPRFSEFVDNGWERVVKYLLDQGTDPTYGGALSTAAKRGNIALIETLIAAGAGEKKDAMDEALSTAVFAAKWQASEKIASHGADLKRTEPSVFTVEWIKKLPKERLILLAKLGADPNYVSDRPSEWETPLTQAIDSENIILVEALLESGAKVNQTGHERARILPIHLAAKKGNEEIISLLVAAGADLSATLTPYGDAKNPHAYTFKGLAVYHPYQPVDYAPFEKVPFLLEKGAKPTANLLSNAIKEKKVGLVKILLSKDADPNGKNYADELHLNTALKYGNNEEIVNLLREHGADFKNADWTYLNKAQRIEYSRTFVYPELLPLQIMVFTPTLSEHAGVRQLVKPGSQSASSFLDLQLPLTEQMREKLPKFGLDDLEWTLFRDGEGEKLDAPLHRLPELKEGDILELVTKGPSLLSGKPGRSGWLPLGAHPLSTVTQTLMRSARIPFKLTLDGKTWNLLLCPDRWFFDPTTNEVPQGALSKIISDIERGGNIARGDLQSQRMVKIHREGFPTLEFNGGDGVLRNFQLLADDHIEILESKEHLENERRKSITAILPGRPGFWRWQAVKHSQDDPVADDKQAITNPTLLQLLADINIGRNRDVYYLPSGDSKSTIGYEEARILPSLHFGKVMIRRLGEEQEETININLNQKLEEWLAGKRAEAPFDLELQAGDVVEFPVSEDGTPGFRDEAHQYLQKALNVTLISQSQDASPNLTLNYHQPDWLDHPFGPLPVRIFGSIPSVRGMYFKEGSSSMRVLRNGRNFTIRHPAFYWPRHGDFVGNIQTTSTTTSPKRTNSSKSTSGRTRYVPRPKK